jgi:hypothetical protein
MRINFSQNDYSFRYLIALAILMGVVLGSWKEIDSRIGDHSTSAGISARDRGNASEIRSGAGAPRSVSDRSNQSAGKADTEFDIETAIETIYASPGLKFRPAYDGLNFIGYEVISSSSDSRFSLGDIVIGVNGEKLANLPVDGEYFMASITDTSVVLDIKKANND